MTTPLTLDTRPLTDAADRADVRAHTAQLRREGRLSSQNRTSMIVLGAVILVFFLIFATSFVGTLSRVWQMGGTSGSVLFQIVPVFMLLVFAAAVVIVLVRFLRGFTYTRGYRLDRFARTNGMTWFPEARNPGLPGMIFGVGHSRLASDIVRGTKPVAFDVANYRYKTGSGKNETTHGWGYVAVRLPHALPHIVLDAVGNNALFGSNLPASFDKSQRLSLEGDFDRHFALYCPRGYERDALYLFTPDIMARFIDNAAALDVEIIDDYMFFYAKRDFSTLDPAMWQWLLSVITVVTAKIAQWERWRDARLPSSDAGAALPAAATAATGAPSPTPAPAAFLRPPPGVAAPGQRLQRTLPWRTIIVVAVFFGVMLLMQSGLFTTILGGFLGR